MATTNFPFRAMRLTSAACSNIIEFKFIIRIMEDAVMRLPPPLACLALTGLLFGTATPIQATTPTVAVIPADSPLLSIDPQLIQCGRPLIAQMDATRITTSWQNRSFPGFKVIGNTYSVGITAVTAYLIDTGDGLILIDTTFSETAPMVAEAIGNLGFDIQDIKIILGSHAHADHQGGTSWFLERVPNAQLMILEGDAATVEAGVPGQPGRGAGMPAAHVNRVLHDGDVVSLGNTQIKVWKTAGHTPGASSFEWTETVDGRPYTVFLLGSQQAAEELEPEGYPGIVADQIAGWTRLLSIQPDVWFGGHSWQHNNIDKYEAMLVDPASNPFIDPEGYRCLVAARAYDFVQELARQRAAAAAGGDRP